VTGDRARGVLRMERHAFGPRVYVLGARVHEWHLGLALGAIDAVAVGAALVPPSTPALLVALIAAWLVLKDWRDLFPSHRDTATWQLGLHRPHSPLRALRRSESLPALAAVVAATVGLANVVWAISPQGSWVDDLLPRVGPLASTPIFTSVALPVGLALILVASSLLQRRRVAWALALALLLVLALLQVLHGPDVFEAGLSAGAAAALWCARRAFYVRTRGSAWLLLRRVAVLVSGCFTLAFAGVFAAVHSANGTSAETVLALMAWRPVSPSPFVDSTAAVPLLVRVATILVLVGSSYLAFRLPSFRQPSQHGDRRHAGRLVRAHGTDTLSFFKLRRDTNRLFSDDGRAFLAYRIEAGVMVISGDPVGPEAALPDLLRGACALAEAQGLRLAVLGASRSVLPLYRQAGLRSFYMGDEAILDTEAFDLAGRPIRKVRQSVNRLERAGYSVGVQALAALTHDELAELGRVSRAWRQGKPERGFSMALDGLDPDEHGDTLVVSARDADGTVRGFLHFVPTYGRAAFSLAAMRREPQTPNGLMEFLVVGAVEALRERGVSEVSLNFAVFARALYSPRGLLERLFARVLRRLDSHFQIESLYRFNAKFFPRWEPRYLLYEGRLGLARAGLAALWVEGQLPRPRRRRTNGESPAFAGLSL
jgi:lysyl-tRNA synthetase, class II